MVKFCDWDQKRRNHKLFSVVPMPYRSWVTDTFMRSEYEEYQRRYASPPRRLLDHIKKHILPSFTEQLAYVKRRKEGKGA